MLGDATVGGASCVQWAGHPESANVAGREPWQPQAVKKDPRADPASIFCRFFFGEPFRKVWDMSRADGGAPTVVAKQTGPDVACLRCLGEPLGCVWVFFSLGYVGRLGKL